jgi:uncharacterized protein (TIGR02246 family)
MTTEKTIVCDEDQIFKLISDWARAVCAEDLDRIMSHYAADATIFDAVPPFQIKGAEDYRRTWEAGLAVLPASFDLETRDLNITVSGDLAVAHWLYRFTGPEKAHPALRSWLRATIGCQRRDGQWQIIHEHTSVPFDPQTAEAVFTHDP